MIKLVMGLHLQINDVLLEKPSNTSPLITRPTLALAGLFSLFDQQVYLLLPTTLFKGTSAKGEVNIRHMYKKLYILQNMD